jgi:peptide/nickel transport system substrate-binding protein
LTGEINAATDLTTDDMAQIVKAQPTTRLGNAHLYNGVYALFRNDSPVLQDKAVRNALRAGVNQKAVIDSLHGYAEALNGPLAVEHFPGLSDIKQPGFDQKAAEASLDAAGWKRPAPGQIRKNKDGAPLQLSVMAPRSGDYARVMEQIAKQWRTIGVDVKTELVDPGTIQQNVLVPRAYDVLIYELAIGADPDIYAYWHSSQATPRGLNLANYKSAASDDALVSARSRSEAVLREAKYRSFVTSWINDVPAVALYEPTLHYVSTQNSRTVSPAIDLPDAVTRYRSVEYWTVDINRQFLTP